ncbi:MAG: hypothetical protein ACHQIM_09265 [Sphingobacteriales bacterium]
MKTFKPINLVLILLILATGTILPSCKKSKSPAKSTTVTVTVSTYAGSASGFKDGTGTTASFSLPSSVALDNAGNVYVADDANFRVRKITAGGVVTTLSTVPAESAGIAVDVAGNVYSGGYGTRNIYKTTQAGSISAWSLISGVNTIYGVAVDPSGNVYVTDAHSSTIYKITPAGIASQFAQCANTGDYGIAVDGSGNVFVGATSVIYKVTAAGVVSVYAGTGATGSADGPAAQASFTAVTSMALDGNGDLFVTDAGNNKIRVISAGGTVSTLAGTGAKAFADGPGNVASFAAPQGITVNSAGTLIYVADYYNNRIREITVQSN